MSRIEDQANYYKNYHLRYRDTVAVIHVEDEDDKRFWLTELHNVKSGDYHFVTQSKSEEGYDSKGCEQCLKYRPYINRQFFICIDSSGLECMHEPKVDLGITLNFSFSLFIGSESLNQNHRSPTLPGLPSQLALGIPSLLLLRLELPKGRHTHLSFTWVSGFPHLVFTLV